MTEKGPVDEGYLIQLTDPYEIPYRSITPFAPSNLLVTCAVSATHIAYGSLRMEPVFMMIGEAAGTAAHLAKAEWPGRAGRAHLRTARQPETTRHPAGGTLPSRRGYRP